MSDRVSIVVPCRNEVAYIEKCIHSLLENGYPNDLLEILIVDGMSDDGTRDVVQKIGNSHPQVRLVDNPMVKTPFGLNAGIQASTGEYVMIASAHSSFDKGYIQTLKDILIEKGADGVGGVMETTVVNSNARSEAIVNVLSHPLGVGGSLFRTGVDELTQVDTVPFGLYKKSTLIEVGAYDERLIRNHDIEMSKRMLAKGARIYLTPKTYCTYYARETWWALAKNNFRNGLWNLKTIKITKDYNSLSIRHFVPLIFLLSVLLPFIGAFFYFPLIFLGFTSLGSYVIVIAKSALEMTKNTSWAHVFYTFLVLHFSYGLGSLVGVFR